MKRLPKVGDIVYLVEPKITHGGIAHAKDQKFFVLASNTQKVTLSLVPDGSTVLTVKPEEVTHTRPSVTTLDHILESEEIE